MITEPRLSDTQSLQATPAFDIRKDMAVVGTGGSKIGKVKEVLSDQLSGSLTHVVVHTGLIFGKDKSIPADLIDNVEGDEVCLKVDKAEIDMLPDLNASAYRDGRAQADCRHHAEHERGVHSNDP